MENSENTVDALLLVEERNEFYKKKFYLMLGVYLLSLIVIGVLGAIFYYLYNHTTKPVYFVADHLGRLIQEPPLNAPIMSDADVANWAVEAIESANTYDFVNFRAQLQNAQKYFTNFGWTTFMKGLSDSNNLLTLQERKWIFVAKVVNKPKLVTKAVVSNVMLWRFEIDLLMSYLKPPLFDEKSKLNSAYKVTIIVQRQKLLESYKGLAVYSMVISPVTEGPRKLEDTASG